MLGRSHLKLHYTARGQGPRGKTNTFPVVEHLAEAEVLTADGFHVVLLKSPLDDLRRVVLTGQLERTQGETHFYYSGA